MFDSISDLCVTASVICVCVTVSVICVCVCVCDSISDLCVCDSISYVCVCVTASVISVCVCVTASVPQLGSPSGYNTLGRPSSLPLSKQNYQRSTSNPDLAGNTPTSPDAEVLAYIGTFMWTPHLVRLNVHWSSVPLKTIVKTVQCSVQIPWSEFSH